ncbi:MAG: hypothetical protein R2710_26835 [Acidimicrobiales bacterium]
MSERSDVTAAIRSSWAADTCAEAGWHEGNPSKGQCEPSSFVAWRYLGGDLVLGRVLVDGHQVEHHYWNRIDGEDLDLTSEQFGPEHVVEKLRVLSSDFLADNMSAMKPEMLRRIELMTKRVTAIVGQPPLLP